MHISNKRTYSQSFYIFLSRFLKKKSEYVRLVIKLSEQLELDEFRTLVSSVCKRCLTTYVSRFSIMPDRR